MISVDRPRPVHTGVCRVDSLQLSVDTQAPNIVRHLISLTRLPDGRGLRLVLGDPKSGEWERRNGEWHEQRTVVINRIAWRVTEAREAGNELLGRRVVMDLERSRP